MAFLIDPLALGQVGFNDAVRLGLPTAATAAAATTGGTSASMATGRRHWATSASTGTSPVDPGAELRGGAGLAGSLVLAPAATTASLG